jgi:hypothetical protein
MRVAGLLLYLGGGMFILLGSLHALYTFLDIRRPRRLVPQDAALALAMTKSHVRLARGGTTMWQAWVGFNFSHSLGAIIFGVLCFCTGTVIGTMALPAWVLFIFVVIGLFYLGLSVLYWFRIPTMGIALAVVCLSAAWLMYAFAGIWCAGC